MNNMIYGCIFAGCAFIFFSGRVILRILRLKSGRYIIVEGRVTHVDYTNDRLKSLSQKGYSAEIEYYINGEKYSLSSIEGRSGYYYAHPSKVYSLGERIELICDTRNPRIAFRKSNPFPFIGMIVSAVILIAFIISMIVH